MNKYTALLPKYLKIIAFLSLVLVLFFCMNHFFKVSATLQDTSENDSARYRTAFHRAVKEHDLGKARVAYEKLKTILPSDDPFLTGIAPSQMAELYLQYAQTLQYDPQSHDLMLAQARLLAPDHPKLLVMKPKMPDLPAMTDVPLELADTQPGITSEHVPESIQLAASAPNTVSLQDQFPDATPPEEEIKDGPPRIPYIDPPPLSPIQEALTEEDFISAPPTTVMTPPSVIATPTTQDPCALSYYSKTQPLTPCIDPVSSNHYGPALFVVGDAHSQPTLAFTQSTVTYQEYEVFCEQTGQCSQAPNEKQSSLIDLKDVQETVSDYNAYCQMSGTCAKIDAQAPKARTPLTRGQVQRYAEWLSKQTGYKYHQPTEQNIVAIQVYFQQCVNAQACPPALMETVGNLLAQPDTVLVRDISNN